MVSAKDLMLPNLASSKPKQYAKKLEVKLDAVLNLNEYQYALSPKVIKAIKSQAENANRYVYYGDKPTSDLIEKIAEYTNLEPENIALDESLDQALNRFPKIFLEHGDNCVMMDPTYPELRFGTIRAGGQVIKVPLDLPEFTFDPDKILKAENNKTKIIFLCNPNNPTSTRLKRDDILKVVENSRAVVLVDECYYEYCGESMADAVNDYDNLYVLRSFSKGFGLAGAKMAYILGSAENTMVYNKIMSGFEYNRYGTFAAMAALDDIAHYEKEWDKIKAEKARITQEFEALGLKVWGSDSAFMFVDISASGKTSTEIKDMLLDDYKILIRDVAATFAALGDKYISFAVPTPDIGKKLIEGFKNVISK